MKKLFLFLLPLSLLVIFTASCRHHRHHRKAPPHRHYAVPRTPSHCHKGHRPAPVKHPPAVREKYKY